MAYIDFDFDPTTVEPSKFGLCPIGEYIAEVTESDYKTTKDATGKFIELKMTILDGPQAGRTITDRLNVKHTNQMAVDIAQRTLKDILDAIGHTEQFRDTSVLHSRPMKIKVSITTRKTTGEDQNSIRYFPVSGGTKTPTTVASSAAAAAGAAKPKPWERK
tara:strand:- start:1940 stop:2422 length:483 start_codon:yes stop_codon:yes gene_type:complete